MSKLDAIRDRSASVEPSDEDTEIVLKAGDFLLRAEKNLLDAKLRGAGGRLNTMTVAELEQLLGSEELDDASN